MTTQPLLFGKEVRSMVTLQQRDPDTRRGSPIWWHHHGYKMGIYQLHVPLGFLILKATAAELHIRKASSVEPSTAMGWYLNWEVIQSRPSEEGVRGRCHFTDEDLAAAFGLSEKSGQFGGWLLKQFGGDSAQQGVYIRWKGFLNIPCPGTGRDGDPNLSMYVSEEIQKAVRQLLEG